MNKTVLLLLSLFSFQIYAQFNFAYNFNTTGRRVCLVNATVIESPASVTLHLLESNFNTSENYTIKRRPINGSQSDWTILASGLINPTYTDTNVTVGQAYEYQVSRNTVSGIATGYVTACVRYDQSDYKGQIILVIDASFQNSLSVELQQLKQDLIYEGWFVNELYFQRATTWETESSILNLKSNIVSIYNNASAGDKPRHLFLFGHLPIARSGQNAIAPDDHIENKGARGADCFYADIDGLFTDVATFNPGNIDSKAINLPGDLKWDQDFIPSELEFAFGRVDFADIAGSLQDEEDLLRNYLNRLHNYRIVADGFDMGNKTAFHFGYDNSNDGSYRSLVPISGVDNVDFYEGNSSFPEWIQQNGPYQIFMQNVQIPNSSEWLSSGMNSTIFSSDQSYWGYWDEPYLQYNYGKIRQLLSLNTKCLGMIYTTTGINIFHQPGMGETMGWSCKRIMDHNATNNLYQKPEQEYDTSEFWNRTHFQYHGDPTLRLNQVKPVSNVQVTPFNGHTINWSPSPDNNILGYHVYRSYTENGPFERLTSSPINELSFIDGDLTAVIRHYIVKAIRLETTGSGTYLNPSIGILASNALNIDTSESLDVRIFPNPTSNDITIITTATIYSYEIIDVQGKVVKSNHFEQNIINISELENGVYFIKINSENNSTTKKIVKI
ncbi:T9SS type A sorting domain-containing protein [Flavobacterium sp. 25HG05S-40]|uniref:T9SS type A sorting domain-containing protein n=1 Tax=Flavobacterium sp. 25HG05S-40 TaxID=3458682 RepID=UPI0040449BE1